MNNKFLPRIFLSPAKIAAIDGNRDHRSLLIRIELQPESPQDMAYISLEEHEAILKELEVNIWKRAAAHAGHPDATEGCRIINQKAREAIDNA